MSSGFAVVGNSYLGKMFSSMWARVVVMRPRRAWNVFTEDCSAGTMSDYTAKAPWTNETGAIRIVRRV